MSVRETAGMVRHTLALSLRADRRVTLAVGVCVLVQSGLIAGLVSAQRWLVDSAGAGLVTGLVAAVALGVAVHVFQLVVQRVSHNYRNDLCNRIMMSLEQEITERAARIPTVAHLERPDFLNRITMLRRGAQALTDTGWAAAYALSAVISIGLSLWLLTGIHPALALLAVSAGPILPLANRAKRLQRAAMDVAAEPMRQEGLIHDLLLKPEPAKEVWISGNGLTLDAKANLLWRDIARLEARARFRGLGGQLAGWALFFGVLAGTLLLVGHLLRSGQATAGDAVLVISLATELRTQLWFAVDSLTKVADGGRVADHHRWLLDYPASDEGAAAPSVLNRGIELRDVHYSYGDVEVLKGITLSIPAGASVGLVGINGAGKSTLVKLLTGVITPTSGQILVDGVDLRDISPSSWASVCTGTFQDFLKLQTPVRDAVGVGDLANPDRIRESIDRAGAAALIAGLPHGLETQLGRIFHGVELSHGQWQRLALARGLMRENPLLQLLDEPTAALDPQAEHELFELFADQTRAQASRGAISVLVSHRFSSVHMTDHIIVLSGGQITESGTHTELLAAGGEYADLYQLQALAYH
ncbi:ABC transporter ATP-binding protein [Nonomuraea turkmeniaca]|uniref:ABC transporter ATP-binding protein n=1 Tax=Nonomuraea turkmeniaca TaxID=103838 RepID=A0A5S4FKJ7_9ACTN|nr:ABC transporter ATP-binding protein [Nonomuraea turkmeniaca]TMR20741.1 ABC transporter ATP-binding protein [Nonomuraea turkmeniaca]